MTLSLRYRPSAYLSASFPRSTAGIQACRNHRLSPLTRLRRPGSGTASSSAKRGRPNKNQPSGARRAEDGGAGRDRTDDLKLAKLPLSQLSYSPVNPNVCVDRQMVGLGRFELPTSPLSGVRSNRLSYRPSAKRFIAATETVCPVRSAPPNPVSDPVRGTLLGASMKKEKRRRRCPANRGLRTP